VPRAEEHLDNFSGTRKNCPIDFSKTAGFRKTPLCPASGSCLAERHDRGKSWKL